MNTKNLNYNRWSIVCFLCFIFLFSTLLQAAEYFHAEGLTMNKRIAIKSTGGTRHLETPIAVKVYFDLLPTKIFFRLPAFPTLVSENDLRYSNNYTETYDPEALIGDDEHRFGLSFEVMQDWESRYARMWIEKQCDARIVVHVIGALCDKNYVIAHTDIPSGSPYGPGDWTDEWYYIYPDGGHVRHVRIYTGLAMHARPFGFDRRTPDVVYEFQETTPIWRNRDKQLEDVDINAITLIKITGESKTFSYKPYPKNYGDMQSANIQVVNLRSKYKPYTMIPPDGAIIQPLSWSANPDQPQRVFGYALGHIMNYKYYKQTENTLEQVFLQGWTATADPVAELVPLAKSWILAPKLNLKQTVMERMYAHVKCEGYDQAQRAYVLVCDRTKPANFSGIDFELRGNTESPVLNPAFVIKNWGNAGAELTLNGTKIERGTNFRYGHECNDLIVWLKHEATTPVQITLSAVK